MTKYATLDHVDTKEVTLIERILGGIIDIIFYVAAFSAISIAFTGQTDNLPTSVAWIPICLFVLVFHCHLNWTPGMKVFGYKFVDAKNLQKPSYGRLIMRWINSFIAAFIIPFGLFALFTFKESSGFYWDRWTNIKVIRNR